MMNYIKDSEEVVLTDHIQNAFVRYESTKIQNTLMSGDVHIQTVGKPRPFLTVTAYGGIDFRNRMNEIEAISEPIHVQARGVLYKGTIADEISWSESGFEYYQAAFEINIVEKAVVT